MPKIINVYVIRDVRTGLYDAGEGEWVGPPDGRRWVPRCTARSRDDADEYDDEDFAETYPDGLPDGFEKIKVSSFESKRKG